jgi:hypothetical protein
MQRLSIVALALCALSGCGFDRSDHPAACKKTTDCKNGGTCVSGYCLVAEDGGKSNDAKKNDGGSSGKADAGGQMGEPCDDTQPPMNCYDGPSGTEGVGVCRNGARACVSGKFTDCLAQTVPSDEMCNAKDDDCDGKVDEITMGDCETQMDGECNAGSLVCRGQYPVCEPLQRPVDETCNAKDDDCDGKTDEITSNIACYPKGETGCKADGGAYTCSGLCKAGKLGCAEGKGRCTDATTPSDEACTKGSALAADEDCDGKIDEGCACKSGDTRPCYSGPDGTEGQGECKAGTQTCVDELWGGACEGEVVSAPETCANPGEDNDCNGTKDDVPQLGELCNTTQYGICRPGTKQCAGNSEVACVSIKEPQQELCDDIDQDCDGNPSNGYDLNNDNANCGKCGQRCGSRDTCCEGSCHGLKDFQEDPKNCGSCGNQCAANEFCCQGGCVKVDLNSAGPKLPGPDVDSLCQCEAVCQKGQVCCGKECVDLNSDADNCGACGHSCKNILGGTGRCANGTCPLL